MAIEVQTERRTGTVTLLSDADIEFVSLVQRGANWKPFQMLKSDKSQLEDTQMPGAIVQAILAPVDKDINELKDLCGEEWFGRLTLDNIEEKGSLKCYVQAAKSAFKAGSLKTQALGESGFEIVTGELKAEKAAKEPKEKDYLYLPTWGVYYDFGYKFEEKVGAFVNVVRGLYAFETDAGKRRAGVMDALATLTDWISSNLPDALVAKEDETPAPEETVKEATEKADETVAEKAAETETAPVEPVASDLPTSKAELEALIAESVKAALESAQATKTETETPPEPVAETVVPDATVKADDTASEIASAIAALTEKLDSITTNIGELQGNLATLSQKTEALEHSPVTTPSGSEDAPANGAGKTAKGKGVFGTVCSPTGMPIR